MADLAAETVTSGGLAATPNPVSSSDTVPFGAIVRVNNGGGASITVTAVTPGTVDGNAIEDKVITVPNGTHKYVRPTVDYRDADTGRVTLLFSDTTTVTAEVIQ